MELREHKQSKLNDENGEQAYDVIKASYEAGQPLKSIKNKDNNKRDDLYVYIIDDGGVSISG